MKKFSRTVAFLMGISLLAPMLAFAQVGVDGVRTNASTTLSARLSAKETQAKERGDQEIDRRIAALRQLLARVGLMQKVTSEFKQSLTTTVNAQIDAFTQLKAKIDADDAATLRTDIPSITQSYRVFALLIPQGRIAAAADRAVAIVGMMGTLGAKLQARISAVASAGGDTSAMSAALTDMSGKLTDAQTQAQAAVTASATLVPDNGDKTKMAANEAALLQARKDIQLAQQDLVAARKDVETILKGLRASASVTASSTTQVH